MKPHLRADRVHNVLLLILEHPPGVPVIKCWNKRTRQAVGEWAMALHLRAGDNDEVTVPDLPPVMAAFCDRNGFPVEATAPKEGGLPV